MVKIEDIIIWIMFILSIIIFLWYIFGNSPNFEQVILGIAITFLLTVSFKIGGFGVRLLQVEKRFIKFEKRFSRL